MSVADKVGQSSSIGRRRSERGRAKAVTEGVIPAYELVRLDLAAVSPTPLNPRRNFGTDKEKTRFGEELRGVQLAACVAVTRDAYLALWPDHEKTIGPECLHVLVNGERRYRSAQHVGLEQLDFVVRDDLASSRADFVDHLLAENLDREDFDVIERARGVRQLVNVCEEEEGERGARSRAAERLGRDRSWVTNQLALLTLPDEVQNQLSSGAVSERDGRTLARHLKEHPDLNAEGLLLYLSSVRESADRQRQEQQHLIEAGRQALQQNASASLLSADNKSPASEAPSEEAKGLLSADNKSSTRGTELQGATPPAGTTAALLSADNKVPGPSGPVGSEQRAAQLDDRPRPGAARPEVPRTALDALEEQAADVAELSATLQYLSDLHREAAGVDEARANHLVNAIRERLSAALDALPDVVKQG
ncbi:MULTISPECIES: ParB/RepB/Spo0J family partition protein [unclassified Streptomyces]|uniref:ParB/RepB/Spo0J family partition protein n=1 Tax=unclassified Streptomyces TaxID=2593676 RepID=UPI0004BDB82A|nr:MULTISPECIES: ParB/RepB/Spo0J family partition protein [unclassified Streptomyces]